MFTDENSDKSLNNFTTVNSLMVQVDLNDSVITTLMPDELVESSENIVMNLTDSFGLKNNSLSNCDSCTELITETNNDSESDSVLNENDTTSRIDKILVNIHEISTKKMNKTTATTNCNDIFCKSPCFIFKTSPDECPECSCPESNWDRIKFFATSSFEPKINTTKLV